MRKTLLRLRIIADMKWLLSLLFLHDPRTIEMFTGEKSRLRLFLLKIFAANEVRFMRCMHPVITSRAMQRSSLLRKIVYNCLLKFSTEHGVAGQYMTLDEIIDFVNGLPEDCDIAQGPCRCRVAIGEKVNCPHPLQTDIIFSTGYPIWTGLFPGDFRPISKEEAIKIIKDSYELGLCPSLFDHMYFQGRGNSYVICNCCADACLGLIGYRIFRNDGWKFRTSPSVAVVDPEECDGCGICVEACGFDERKLVGGKSLTLNCQGCGQCAYQCPNDAITMVKRR